MTDGLFDLFLQAARLRIVNVAPEADALFVEFAFELVDEGRVRVAVGDEEWRNLKSLVGAQVVDFIEDVVDLLVGEIGVVEFCSFDFKISQPTTAQEGNGDFAFGSV